MWQIQVNKNLEHFYSQILILEKEMYIKNA